MMHSIQNIQWALNVRTLLANIFGNLIWHQHREAKVELKLFVLVYENENWFFERTRTKLVKLEGRRNRME